MSLGYNLLRLIIIEMSVYIDGMLADIRELLLLESIFTAMHHFQGWVTARFLLYRLAICSLHPAEQVESYWVP